jgi:hypothetical protein
MRSGLLVLCISGLLGSENAGAQASANCSTNAPASIELRDQFDAPQRLSFPATNVVVLTIADRKGSEEVDGWIAALKPLYVGRVDFRGLADVGGVPGLFQGRLRQKFQEKHKHPVMMDWSGKTCAQFGYQRGVANLLVIDCDGWIRARFRGHASPAAVAEACAALEAAHASVDAKPSADRPQTGQ